MEIVFLLSNCYIRGKFACSIFSTIFVPILVPTWLHVGTKNGYKTIQTSIFEVSKMLIEFLTDI